MRISSKKYLSLGVALALGLALMPRILAQENLALDDYIQRVLNRNEQIQIQMLRVVASDRKIESEKGIFEPALVGSVELQDSDRPNTAQQQRNQLGVATFDQENILYSGGLEQLSSLGGKLQMGYSLSDLNNNLQSASTLFSPGRLGNEFVSFAGLTLTQPLLKNGGRLATTIRIRVAAQDSEIAFQNYRREMMRTVTGAEALYWDLYFAQRQLKSFNQSVSVTESLFQDTKARRDLGNASDLDVLEIESTLAQRRTQSRSARQTVIENANRLVILYGGSPSNQETPAVTAAEDPPSEASEVSARNDLWMLALDHNPEFKVRQFEALKQQYRFQYAKNQKLPELDLTSSYGLNGLGATPGDAMDNIGSGDFASWSVGLRFKVPLGGGKQAKRLVEVAALDYHQASIALKEIENQLLNSIDTAVFKIQTSAESSRDYQKIVGFYESLLNTELERLQVGSIPMRRVLDAEEALLKARLEALQSVVNFQRSRLELESLVGTALRDRGIDLPKQTLVEKTRLAVAGGVVTDSAFEAFRNRVREDMQIHRITNP